MVKVLALYIDSSIREVQLDTAIHSKEILWYWADFSESHENEIALLSNVFHFHPLAIEDCLHNLQRPKYDHYDEYTFFVLHALNESLHKQEIDFFIGETYIVSFHKEKSKEIEEVWNLLREGKESFYKTYAILHRVMDKLVDNYFPILYRIEDELNEIDDDYNHRNNTQFLMNKLFDIRGELLQLRHTIYPMRDLLYRMLNSQRLVDVIEKKEYFSDVYDHLIKLAEMIESNREITTDVRDSYLSLNAHLTNRNMMVLTVITTIFMPITFIAGVYGMNFSYMPELNFHYGYFAVLGVMGIIVIVMFLWFKKKGWFD